MINVSFIILNYNDSGTTMRLVDSILDWKSDQLEKHIIIVDNCSRDNSLEELNRKYSDNETVDVLESEKNGGYSYGNNYGTRYAIQKYGSQYIAIANPDILIEEGSFIELLHTFDADQTIGMCAPVMQSIDGQYSVHSQTLPTFWDDLKACFCTASSKTIHKENYAVLNNNPNMIITEMLPGSFFAARADYFRQVGMLDEGVFLFCEERIIGHLMKAHGYKLILRADLFFAHAHSTSIKKVYDPLRVYRMILNSRYYYEVNYNNINFPQRMVLRAGIIGG